MRPGVSTPASLHPSQAPGAPLAPGAGPRVVWGVSGAPTVHTEGRPSRHPALTPSSATQSLCQNGPHPFLHPPGSSNSAGHTPVAPSSSGLSQDNSVLSLFFLSFLLSFPFFQPRSHNHRAPGLFLPSPSGLFLSPAPQPCPISLSLPPPPCPLSLSPSLSSPLLTCSSLCTDLICALVPGPALCRQRVRPAPQQHVCRWDLQR